jgi:hypothetical protein
LRAVLGDVFFQLRKGEIVALIAERAYVLANGQRGLRHRSRRNSLLDRLLESGSVGSSDAAVFLRESRRPLSDLM